MPAEIPADVADRHERPARPAEAVAPQLDVLVLERVQQRADVPRGPGPRERERRDVDADSHPPECR